MEERIIKNLHALREDYQSLHILCRQTELNELSHSLKPAYFGRKPINIMLSGKPGTGKTTIAKHVLDKLKRETNLSGAYVNLWENNTLYSVLEKLVQKERIFFAEAQATKLKLTKFREHIKGQPYLVVLDEIDVTSPKERENILRAFLEIDEVAVICTCQNTERLLLSLDERIRSRFLASRIELEPYSKDNLVNILKQRAQLALNEESFDEKILKIIANSVKGDCRVAIQTLRIASEIAETDGCQIRYEHVKKAIESASLLKKRSYLNTLTEHHRIIYRIIEKRRGILSPSLWKTYQKKCETKGIEPIARRTFTKYIRKLKTLSLIESKRASVRGRVRRFVVKGDG